MRAPQISTYRLQLKGNACAPRIERKSKGWCVRTVYAAHPRSTPADVLVPRVHALVSYCAPAVHTVHALHTRSDVAVSAIDT